MAYYNWNDVTNWKMYPIYQTEFVFDSGNHITITNVMEANSYIKFNEIFSESNDDAGCPRVVAYGVESEIIVLQNDYFNFDVFIHEIINHVLINWGADCHIEDSDTDAIQIILPDYSCKLSHSIEFKEDYPILKLNIKGIITLKQMAAFLTIFSGT